MMMGNMDAIMENKRFAIGAINNVDKMKEFYKIDEQNDLKKKYAPFVPQMRPWLTIVEVNMTNVTLNTECTGETFPILFHSRLRHHCRRLQQ